MQEIVRRAIRAVPELTTELLRRGMFLRKEREDLLRRGSGRIQSAAPSLGTVQFATLLSQGDAQLAARAVLRGVVSREELQWLHQMVRFGKRNDKREELVRVVERALEGRKGNVRRGKR